MVTDSTTSTTTTTTTTSTTPLVAEIATLYGGTVDGKGLMTAFRNSMVWVPTAAENAENSMVTAEFGGFHWLYAFSTEAELARFGATVGSGDQVQPYLTTRGSRLLDAVLPAMDQPAGIAVDVAGQRPMLLPAAPGELEAADGTDVGSA